MNRLYHLKETFVKNIEDNVSYENIEFVLLDYNSNDEIKKWVKEDLQKYVDMGILKFYSTSEPETFHRSHSRNVAMKLATGDIICNLDADNYLGKDFAFYINYEFSFNEKIFLTSGFSDGSYGKICVQKNDFLSVRGYDERLSGWGYEDDDLYARLEGLGLERIEFVNADFAQFIEHEMEESFENDKNVTDIANIYIKHVDFNESDLLFLYKDGKFKYGTVKKPMQDESDLRAELLQERWFVGPYQQNGHCITLQLSETESKELNLFDPTKNDPVDSFHQVKDKELQNHLLIQLTSLANKKLYEKQRSARELTPNLEGWGETILTA
jgi:glycosyltransferase involved in cell wall biosynthesis